MLLYDKFIKNILFRFDAENAHNVSMLFLRLLNAFPILNFKSNEHFIINNMLKDKIDGMNFLNPLGMAAGFDKNANVVRALASFGFAFTEVGTITPNAQNGNAKPRIFRHEDEFSLQNSLGFNNCGSQIIRNNLNKVYPFATPIGVNIGKNANVPQEFAISDYIHMIKHFANVGAYITMNLSSPNTKNLRDLQNEDFVKELFTQAKQISDKPMYLKIAPDLEADDAIKISLQAIQSGADGIIATNTSNDYSLVNNAMSLGGISGLALKEKSFNLFKTIAKELYGKTTLISVGGIDSADEAYRRIKHGASLVQVYTAFIYKGYNLAKDINLGLIELLKKDGYSHISEARGVSL